MTCEKSYIYIYIYKRLQEMTAQIKYVQVYSFGHLFKPNIYIYIYPN